MKSRLAVAGDERKAERSGWQWSGLRVAVEARMALLLAGLRFRNCRREYELG